MEPDYLPTQSPKLLPENKKYRVVFISIIALVLVAVSVLISRYSGLFTDNSKSLEITQDQAVATNITDSALAVNYFGLNLLKKIDLKEDNILLSPSNISAALTMAANGATGDTQDEMLKVLGIDRIGINQSNVDFQRKIQDLNQSSENLEISFANSIWTTANNEFLPSYKSLVNKYFDAKAEKANSATDINNWVADKTNNKIRNILDDLTNDLYLVNAVYFNGKWQVPFEVSDTKKEDFTTRSSTIKADMMNMTTNYDYFSNSKLQAVKLSYKNNFSQPKYSMIIVLPAKNSTLADFLTSFDYQSYQKINKDMSDNLVELKLPKFELDYKEDKLVEKLQFMGMQKAFGDKAELTKISPLSLKIDQIIHQAYVKVDEKGTEAAAATVVGTNSLGIASEPPEPIKMYIDRPFFFSIQNDQTNEILFAGIIQNPAK